MDGGRSRIPTLTVKDPITKQVVKEARTNEEKWKLLYQELFAKITAPLTNNTDYTYVQEKWAYTPTTDEQIHRAISRMKLWKATCSDSIPNVVFVHARHLMVPYLGLIFRATDMLEIYPEDWKHTETPILKSLGSPITWQQEHGGLLC